MATSEWVHYQQRIDCTFDEGLFEAFAVSQLKGEFLMCRQPKRRCMAIAAAFASLSSMCALGADPQGFAITGFISPETVVHDPLTDTYLVSNVGGAPVNINHGFISRVSPDGTILDLRWIEDGAKGVTLHGPKGICLYGTELYVADVDTLRVFNRFTGAPLRSIPIPDPFANPAPPLGAPGALFLNHVVVADDGTAYISDQLNKRDLQGGSNRTCFAARIRTSPWKSGRADARRRRTHVGNVLRP
jgi:hypothetical protein